MLIDQNIGFLLKNQISSRLKWAKAFFAAYTLAVCQPFIQNVEKTSPKHLYEEVSYRLERTILAGSTKEDGFSAFLTCGGREYAVLVVDSHVAIRLPQPVTKVPKGESVSDFQKARKTFSILRFNEFSSNSLAMNNMALLV